MANSTVLSNGDTGYVTSVVGTVTNYIPAASLSTYTDPAANAGVSELAYIDAAAGIAAASSDELTGLTITSGGSDYILPPVVSFTGGGGSGAEAEATISEGKVVSLTLTALGSGYTSAPTVVFTNAAGDTVGSGATATAQVASGVESLQVYLSDVDYLNGQNAWARFGGYVLSIDSADPLNILNSKGVVSVDVTAGGSGYGSAPTVTFTSADGNGSGAAGTAVLTDGVVTSVTITATGSGYTAVPTVVFSSGAAAATAVLGTPVITASLSAVGAQLAAVQGIVAQLAAQADLQARNN